MLAYEALELLRINCMADDIVDGVLFDSYGDVAERHQMRHLLPAMVA